MDVLTGTDMQKAIPLFDAYDCNQAVIFSIFENQFNGCIYTNDASNMHWAILRTPFLQHFIAGQPVDGCEAVVEEVLFNIILKEQDEKEIAVFATSEQWHDLLDRIFHKHKGVSDGRKIFAFCFDNYRKISRPEVPLAMKPVVTLQKALPNSHMDTWCARLLLDGRAVSHCDAIMMGKGMAEVDIGTEENCRGKGYATLAATLLIDKLLENKLTPTWSTWPFRVESQHIAQKLGFIAQPDAKAWIWMEGM